MSNYQAGREIKIPRLYNKKYHLLIIFDAYSTAAGG
jgi:hypothetical protein